MDSSVAPLLGLVALFGIHTIYLILFVDAIVAPLGTANVYTAATGRVLYSLGQDFLPKSILTRLNKHSAPAVALWISATIGMCFLLPFPTWMQLVSFLSSIVVFAYLAGPLVLIILRQEFPQLPRTYKVHNARVIGYAGFACCSLLIYWSELTNLSLLCILIVIVIIGYALISKTSNILNSFKDSWVLIGYLLNLTLISYLRSKHLIPFPVDNLLVILTALIFCKILVNSRLEKSLIAKNLSKLHLEINHDSKN
jgi:amino acid transporter